MSPWYSYSISTICSSRIILRQKPDKDKFEQVLQLYENTLLAHERRAELWHEHSKQLVGVVRRLEKHLVALRWHSHKYHSSSASADSLPLSLLDIGKPYPSRPYAAGLPVRRCSDDWQPKWDVFPLKAFRGPSYTYLKIHAGWDDAALLRELGRSYDTLRTVWRKWFSLRSVRSISMVYADHTCVYPRRIGPAGLSPSKNMRLRYFLRHPEQMKDRHEFMQVLTARTDLGIEFVEGWQLSRIAVAILLPVLASLVLAVLYSALYGDVSGAFTIAGYMTSAYSVCLVLLGLLNFVEF
ncbi:hypothetical protein GSI_09503 [Ganoderma sinense ZZ0214-1]|uniref:Uncharacterized protein n=1 Tax=Ganoderma sinense ZZ0214-1 TaxID=1077348 RepID=A0A2G8S3K4_9APHY|nr:hypothetical protein GSI_09503 [Ganoderma sinense ZZ0214-1]